MAKTTSKKIKEMKDFKHVKSLSEAKRLLESGDASNLPFEGKLEAFAQANRGKTIAADIEKGYKVLIEKDLPTQPVGVQESLDFGDLTIDSEIKEDITYGLDVTLGEMYKISDKLGVTSKYEKRSRSKDIFFKAFAAKTLEPDLAAHVTVVKQNQYVVKRKKK